MRLCMRRTFASAANNSVIYSKRLDSLRMTDMFHKLEFLMNRFDAENK